MLDVVLWVLVTRVHGLTIDVDPDGLEGRGPEAVLSLAVISSTLMSLDVTNAQRLVKHGGVMETVRGASCRLSPANLKTEETMNTV